MTKRGIITLLLVAAAIAAAVVVVVLTGPSGPDPEPEPVYIIALDPGHGGRDPGAVADDVLEKDLNLQIVERLRPLIEAEPNLAVKVTRTLDIKVPNEDRIQIAEDAGAEMYISVHINSFTSPDANGIETIVSDTRPQDDDSWVLGELLQDALVEATGARDRGTRAQASYMHRTEMPAVSTEVGYITNPEERSKLVDPAYQQRIAEGILEGIRRFIEYKHPQENELL